MKRAVAGVAALALALALAWWLWPAAAPVAEAPAPAPAPAPTERRPLPRTYQLERVDAVQVPEPAEPQTEDEPSVPVEREVLRGLVRAGNQAMGDGWQNCVRPWVEARGETHPPPLVMNLVVRDGIVSDIELTAHRDLPPELLRCFADQAWSVSFPEDPSHRGEVRVQRTMGVRQAMTFDDP